MYLGLYPVTTTTVTTHIIVTTNLLTLTNEELEAQIEAELAENPALERTAEQRCPRCGAPVEKPPCLDCMRELLSNRDVQVDTAPWSGRAAAPADDDFDPVQLLAQPIRLADHILGQLRPQLAPAELPIAGYLAEALDERGFLAVTVEQAAAGLKVPVQQVEEVLVKLQRVDPVGVGARNPRECLLRQVEMLPAEAERVAMLQPVAHRVLAEYWEQFLHARWAEIPIPNQQLMAAVAFIRANLTPYPALAGWEGELAQRQGPSEPTVYSRPDMVIYYDGDGELAVELFGFRPRWLRLSPSFHQMIRSANGDCQDSWREMAERARLFIKCLGQREQTLRRAVELLVSYQEQAIRQGDAYIQPLTRTQLAQMLEIHEATVSRAVMGKTVALPDGRIVPLAHFFESGKSTKETIRQMIAEEAAPLSDSEIAERLDAMGHSVARRTVAKYRNMLGILPVHLRVRQKEQVLL